ncbi:MAG: hypothetical protein J6K45_08155 [Clostridia bacterium]|nr:hypothetical protein [Clostridia bacterium]
MLPHKKSLYKKAYKELYEVIRRLTKSELEKLPNDFIMNVHEQMDTDYEFVYNESVGLLEQDFMVETKALIIEMYRRFLSDESENEYWKKYDQKCFEITENEKRKKYNPNRVFNNIDINIGLDEKEVERSETSMVKIEESFFKKLLNIIKRIFVK